MIKRIFWMSPMVFEAAIKSPNILDGYHACGYGKTYDYIKSKIKDKSKSVVLIL